MPTTQQIIPGDCIEGMRTLPDASVHCCVTSPPYWNLRDYKHDGQIGLESTPEAYVARMVEVFREVRRLLRDDGTCWVNLGDSYAGGGGFAPDAPCNVARREMIAEGDCKQGVFNLSQRQHTRNKSGGIKPQGTIKAKDLVGIPWRVAFALQADGWWLRQDIIWHKPNPCPESVTDRCTKAHEYVFLLTKSKRYFYDADAIRQPLRWQDPAMLANNAQARQQKRLTERVLAGDDSALRTESDRRTAMLGMREKGRGKDKNAERTLRENILGANRRSVWTISTKPYSGAHFAVMPADLVEPCIKAGCPEQCCPACGKGYERIVEKGYRSTEDAAVEGRADAYTKGSGRNDAASFSTRSGQELAAKKAANPDKFLGWQPACECDATGTIPGTVLDPFAGSGTTLAVAAEQGRSGIGCELNPEYIALAKKRIREARESVALFEGIS